MKINIIGAGISGLSAGCYLQMNGFETEIFEKHTIPGGLCTSWNKKGFLVDGCAHWIMGSGPGSSFYKIYNELLDMESIPFLNHDIRMVIEVKETVDKYGSNQFKLYTNLNQLQAYLLDLSPEDSVLIISFISDIRKMQKYDLPPILDDLPFVKSAIRGFKMIKYVEFLFLFLKWNNETNYTFSKRFKNPFLQEAIRLLYDNEEVKMMVMMMPLAFFDVKSCGYPLGGSIAFAKYFETRYLELGGKIQYRKAVKEIIVEDNVAKGILLSNSTFVPSDITLSTADWKLTVFNLLKGSYVNDKLIKLKDEKSLAVFYSVVQVSFGINADLSDLPHFFRFPLDEKIVSPDGTIYDRMEVHLYHYDPAMAPEGKTTVVISFYTLNRDFWIDLRTTDRRKYRSTKANFIMMVLDRLDKRLNIKDKIEMMDMATPATILRYTNNWKGSTQGWLPGKNLIASSPVKFKLPKLSQFYYASHWSQPGGGLPIAIMAARSVTKLICKQNGKKFSINKRFETI
ncbi:MAG: NAD(P)/FAD-dependent oxidoreductase [Chitinophagales bacterium]|nr:NAD(P)/FAD-dependent oxidoreductase [Chitinophagales bacterium]